MNLLVGAGRAFGLVAVLLAVFGLTGLATVLRRLWYRRRALGPGGLAAEAVCLETTARRREGGGLQRRMLLEFRDGDGEAVRVSRPAPPLVVPGDHVVVRYLPGDARRAVPAGSTGGVGGLTVVVVFIAFFICLNVGFALAAFGNVLP